MIDLTKKYRTRDGRAVTGLRKATGHEGWREAYTILGELEGSRNSWLPDGQFLEGGINTNHDLVPAEEGHAPVTGLLTPDPLRTEYGAFVAAVKANFSAGTFATATQEQFDAWLESLTPSLRA